MPLPLPLPDASCPCTPLRRLTAPLCLLQLEPDEQHGTAEHTRSLEDRIQVSGAATVGANSGSSLTYATFWDSMAGEIYLHCQRWECEFLETPSSLYTRLWHSFCM